MTELLAEIFTNTERIAAIPPGAVPVLLAELEAIRARLWAHLLAHPQAESRGLDQGQADRLLTPAEAAPLLGVTVPWLYRHHRHLPFTRRLSRRALRFSEAGLRRWLARK